MLLVANLGIKIDNFKSICCFYAEIRENICLWHLFLALQSAR